MEILGAFAFLILLIVPVALVAKSSHKKKPSAKSQNALPRTESEENRLERKITTYTGRARITQADVRAYAIRNMSQDFASMPDWSVWDESIHQSPGQFERMRRAVEEKISTLAYDPKRKMAKMRGSGGEVYLTSASRCSCPDFRERRLPCKHMYALAVDLEGNPEQVISDAFDKPLYPLSFALAGRFQGRKDSPENIRKQISDRGGTCMDDINPRKSSAVVVGNAPSQARIDRARRFDMEIMTPETALDLFSLCQKSGAQSTEAEDERKDDLQ